jgi:hypothetical protein
LHQLSEIRDALASHPVVALVGARGTAKTLLADRLIGELERSAVTVVRLDARDAETPRDLNVAIARALQCEADDLTAGNLPEGRVVRVVIDNCHEFYDKKWFPYLQEQWRALLSSASARGRVAILLIGRPLFRRVAGGDGSPLLNIGPTLATRPLSVAEVSDAFEVTPEVAAAVVRKTGGHPALTGALIAAIEGEIARMGNVISGFISAQERYLLKLAEDHSLAALALLADLTRSDAPVAHATLIAKHFGDAFIDGQEALRDLIASGLVKREGANLIVAAELLRQVTAVREFIRVPTFELSDEPPDEHNEAAALLYGVENRLRRLIAETLGAIDAAWWPARVPTEFVAEAELRRRAELDSAAAADSDYHPILYLSLGELFDLIWKRENWDQAFSVRIHRTLPMARDSARDVTAVRNKLAHSRPVNRADVDLLRAGARRLGLLPSNDA